MFKYKSSNIWKKNKYFISFVSLVLLIALGLFAYYSITVYALTPRHLRRPEYAHYHFRMQLNIDGNDVNFSEEKYQEVYKPDACSVELTETPIHFHDKKDQLVHIHWQNMTGGEVLKYYGLNKIGGLDTVLGYRIDKNKWPSSIPILGKILPKPNMDSKMYIYTKNGDNNFEKREENDFLKQDLQDFFAKKTTTNQNFNVKVLADDEESKLDLNLDRKVRHTTDDKDASEEELKEIHSLAGDVVIFIQKDEPKQEQIQQKFDNLIELEKSTCGG